jgi:hypothetical protein
MSDQDLGQAVLGTWRVISCQFPVDGVLVKPLRHNPQGYLVYMSDGHMFVQLATPAERNWPGAEVLQLSSVHLMTALAAC